MKLTNNHSDSLKLLPSRPTDLLLLPSLFSSLSSSNHQCLSSDSPDSGKGKEISSESISDPFFPNNSTKTFSINDDLFTQSVSLRDNTQSQQQPSAYCSTSPSLTSSSRSSSTSIKQKRSQQLTTNDHYLYHQIPLNNSSSFTNSAFTQSPHRTVVKEFDPFIK